jgi:hypothetical protein
MFFVSLRGGDKGWEKVDALRIAYSHSLYLVPEPFSYQHEPRQFRSSAHSTSVRTVRLLHVNLEREKSIGPMSVSRLLTVEIAKRGKIQRVNQ